MWYLLALRKGAVCSDMYRTNKWLKVFFLKGFVKLDILWSTVDLEIKTNISLQCSHMKNKSCHICIIPKHEEIFSYVIITSNYKTRC